jgi:hypothetical protein
VQTYEIIAREMCIIDSEKSLLQGNFGKGLVSEVQQTLQMPGMESDPPV